MIKQDRITQIFFLNGKHCPCGIKCNVCNKKGKEYIYQYNIANYIYLYYTQNQWDFFLCNRKVTPT